MAVARIFPSVTPLFFRSSFAGALRSYNDFAPHRASNYGNKLFGFSKNERERNTNSGFSKDLSLSPLNFENLPEFNRDLYEEHEAVANMSKAELEAFHTNGGIQVAGMNPPNPITSFEHIILPDVMKADVSRFGFEKPTLIQSQGWPVMLKGRDLVGIAETGSGKTLAFALPALLHVAAQEHTTSNEGPIVLILAPVRELASQIHEELGTKFKSTTGAAGIKTSVIYGQMGYQESSNFSLMLRKSGIDILVATPGRLLDNLKTGKINMNRCTMVIVDEADRMLDMGFGPDLNAIFSQIRPDRQVCMWSATWPTAVRNAANNYLNKPVYLSVSHSGDGPSNKPRANPKVEQKFIFCNRLSDKEEALLSFVRSNAHEKMIIFCNKKIECNNLKRGIEENINGIEVGAVHGDVPQGQRESILKYFRTPGPKILVCTDIYARGLDVSDITTVINYHFPNDIDSYVHRIGRTARGANKGRSVTFLVPKFDDGEFSKIVSVLKEAKQEIPKELLVNNSFGFSEPQSSQRRGYEHRGFQRNNGSNFGRF